MHVAIGDSTCNACHHMVYTGQPLMNTDIYVYIYIYMYTTSEKPVNDQSYWVLDRCGIALLYK